jgi:hypothetical protein
MLEIMYPAWPIWSRDLAPSTLSTYSPPLSAWVMGTQSTSSPQQGWTWTVEWTLASSPTQDLCPSENVRQYCYFFPYSNNVFWNAYKIVICAVLIVVIIFRFD